MSPTSWRAAILGALVLLAAPLLAGCVGTASAASAKEWQTPADEAAKAWDADATLVNVVGAEGTFPMALAARFFGFDDGAGGEDWAEAEGDEKVGDGKAELWLYRYVSENKETAYAVVVAEGKVIRAEEDSRHEEDAPLGAWVLDSDAALAAALEANEGLRVGVQGEHYGIGAFLSRMDADSPPRWMIAGMGGGASGGGGGYVLLDAETGEVIESQGGFRQS